ncbi:Transposable element tcb2 transposase [Caligus rogercresseyi]|uniref:Transposable element tcb2 transposase n=1 Tax=Caligus rogercresseyi TaxID=217165 RepID=A0A7T8GLB1_CALRO|nr:Transposable element tcb2 transposase [Caligus rogercresseyi]
MADRVSKGKILINQMKSKSGFLRFFSDDKLFTIDASHNRRNDRWICLDADEVKPFMKTKNPASNMVLAVISTEGDVMPPYFFQKKETVNKEVYKRVLEEQSIIKTMKELDPQEVSRACISFRRRVDSVVKNGGSHYE